jgi:hypothetical protein
MAVTASRIFARHSGLLYFIGIVRGPRVESLRLITGAAPGVLKPVHSATCGVFIGAHLPLRAIRLSVRHVDIAKLALTVNTKPYI